MAKGNPITRCKEKSQCIHSPSFCESFSQVWVRPLKASPISRVNCIVNIAILFSKEQKSALLTGFGNMERELADDMGKPVTCQTDGTSWRMSMHGVTNVAQLLECLQAHKCTWSYLVGFFKRQYYFFTMHVILIMMDLGGGGRPEQSSLPKPL